MSHKAKVLRNRGSMASFFMHTGVQMKKVSMKKVSKLTDICGILLVHKCMRKGGEDYDRVSGSNGCHKR